MFSEEMICSLNDLELEVYKYVVRNADKVCYMRIREFADAAHVSTSTILRFCKKAGCDGYAEFKIRLRQHLEQAKQPPVKDDVSEVIDFLKKTCSAEFEQKLDMLTRVIFQARHIFFVGSGMSGIVAKYGARYFSSMGKFCLYIDEPPLPHREPIRGKFAGDRVFGVRRVPRHHRPCDALQGAELPDPQRDQHGKLHHRKTLGL